MAAEGCDCSLRDVSPELTNPLRREPALILLLPNACMSINRMGKRPEKPAFGVRTEPLVHVCRNELSADPYALGRRHTVANNMIQLS